MSYTIILNKASFKKYVTRKMEFFDDRFLHVTLSHFFSNPLHTAAFIFAAKNDKL